MPAGNVLLHVAVGRSAELTPPAARHVSVTTPGGNTPKGGLAL